MVGKAKKKSDPCGVKQHSKHTAKRQKLKKKTLFPLCKHSHTLVPSVMLPSSSVLNGKCTKCISGLHASHIGGHLHMPHEDISYQSVWAPCFLS